MVKKELVSWVKDGLVKGHELEKLLSHLKKQGYAEVDIVEVRSHVSEKKQEPAKSAPSSKGNTFIQVLHWINGLFFEPQKTLKEIANHSRLVHVTVMGAISIAVLFSTFVLNSLMVKGITTLPLQILESATRVLSPQGSFTMVIGFGELTLTGIFANLIATVIHYFVPLLGISFTVYLILKGLSHKCTMWEAYKIIGIPYGAVAIVLSFVNLAIVPFMFIAEQVGSASFLAKLITGVVIAILVILMFFSIAISLYSYAAYAMIIKEKYGTTNLISIIISIASTATVVVALMPMIAMFVASVF